MPHSLAGPGLGWQIGHVDLVVTVIQLTVALAIVTTVSFTEQIVAAVTGIVRGALSLEQRYYGNARVFQPDQLAEVLRRHDADRMHADITGPHYRGSAGWDAVARMQHVDLFTWLRGDILVKADAMTMANPLELRVPFLDPAVFAVASGLPVDPPPR